MCLYNVWKKSIKKTILMLRTIHDIRFHIQNSGNFGIAKTWNIELSKNVVYAGFSYIQIYTIFNIF